jgi:hypothetical protein
MSDNRDRSVTGRDHVVQFPNPDRGTLLPFEEIVGVTSKIPSSVRTTSLKNRRP